MCVVCVCCVCVCACAVCVCVCYTLQDSCISREVSKMTSCRLTGLGRRVSTYSIVAIIRAVELVEGYDVFHLMITVHTQMHRGCRCIGKGKLGGSDSEDNF